MDELVAAVNIHAHGMAEVLGYSHEQVLRECTLRELLLYLGTVKALAPAQLSDITGKLDEAKPKAPGPYAGAVEFDSDEAVANFIAEATFGKEPRP